MTAVVLFSGLTTATVPELDVSPSEFNDSLAATEEHRIQFLFSNQDSSKKIYNTSLADTDWLNWTRNRFDVNNSSTVNVTAVIQTEEPRTFNQSFNVSYRYNDTTGNDTGIKSNSTSLAFRFETFYRETSIDANPFQIDFQLQFEESDSSVLVVENTGGEKAFNIEMNGSDVDFEKESFDLPPGEDRLIKYNISLPKPEENATAKTNQTHIRTVTVTGENFDPVTFNLSVFVPFKQYDTEEREKDLLAEILQNRELLVEFCGQPENQDSLLCGGQIVKFRNKTKVVYRTPKANVTLNESSIKAINRLGNESVQGHSQIRAEEEQTQKEIRRMSNRFSRELNESQATDREVIRMLNKTLQESREEDRTQSFWMKLSTGLIFLALISLGLYKGFRKIQDIYYDPRF